MDNKVQSTTALAAARGRGKSAALGLGIAGAIAAGCVTCRMKKLYISVSLIISFSKDLMTVCRYSNIFVTAPTTENLKSLFEFVCRGLQALEYEVGLSLCND